MIDWVVLVYLEVGLPIESAGFEEMRAVNKGDPLGVAVTVMWGVLPNQLLPINLTDHELDESEKHSHELQFIPQLQHMIY